MLNFRSLYNFTVLILLIGGPQVALSMVTSKLDLDGSRIVSSSQSTFSPDSSKVIVRNPKKPNELFVYSTSNGALLATLSKRGAFSIWKAQWSPDGNFVLTYNSDGTISLWRFSS